MYKNHDIINHDISFEEDYHQKNNFRGFYTFLDFRLIGKLLLVCLHLFNG